MDLTNQDTLILFSPSGQLYSTSLHQYDFYAYILDISDKFLQIVSYPYSSLSKLQDFKAFLLLMKIPHVPDYHEIKPILILCICLGYFHYPSFLVLDFILNNSPIVTYKLTTSVIIGYVLFIHNFLQ